jgi:hypothetical protein
MSQELIDRIHLGLIADLGSTGVLSRDEQLTLVLVAVRDVWIAASRIPNCATTRVAAEWTLARLFDVTLSLLPSTTYNIRSRALEHGRLCWDALSTAAACWRELRGEMSRIQLCQEEES